jgi:hypothetical protein
MESKSKDQLIQELRERVYALEEIESDRDAIEPELKTTRQRLQQYQGTIDEFIGVRAAWYGKELRGHRTA